MLFHWDIFCRVVDNYGDIGVCWRLARQLAGERGQAVRLWVDEPGALAAICPACDPRLPAQRIQEVEVCRWPADFAVDRVAEVVIEAFACDLPAAYVARMASAARKPCWINLEYLSAETWIEGCHGLASPHPGLPLVKHFFFPGFTSASGGLLREAGLLPAPLPDPAAPLEISLFCYDSAPVGGLLAALAASPRPLVCHVPPGRPLAAVSAALGPAEEWNLGQARIQPIPFLPLDDYDALLRRCAVNFVRGEDSFVRAQWAGRPFIWQIYPQDEAAHQAKLDAFLDRYCAALTPAAASAVRALFSAWNGGNGDGGNSNGGDVAAAWPAFLAQTPEIARHNVGWARQLAEQPDLATRLVNFVAARV
ncbi:MAG: elongation factor P maturation arginine rhamnosyltransferase EarP [Desulfobulbus sp.]|nr:elongation factor P maturation arginine rhamnosyltransferase EarP [Desulfobulbus sp.]